MNERDRWPKTINIGLPLWTIGFLYTMGVIMAGDGLEGSIDALLKYAWHVQILFIAAVYVLWPFFLGITQYGGWK